MVREKCDSKFDHFAFFLKAEERSISGDILRGTVDLTTEIYIVYYNIEYGAVIIPYLIDMNEIFTEIEKKYY